MPKYHLPRGADWEEANTCQADNTRVKRATMMLTHECSMAAIQIPQHYLNTSNHGPRVIARAIVDGETGARLKYHNLKTNPKYQDTWKKSYGNEIGRLSQGMPGRVMGTNTMFFITKDKIPTNRL